MPLKHFQKLLRMESSQKNEKVHQHRKSASFLKKKDKFGRKRSQSFTAGLNLKFSAPYRCRKRPMLPTKFLLGGNICDPLNLNSLQDEEINRTVNAVTPKSSPIPTPPQRRGHIEVIIPPNIHDPLNLIDCADDAEYEQQLTSPLKKGGKRRKKKKRTISATTESSDSASEAKTPEDSAKIPEEVSPDEEKVTAVTKDLMLDLNKESVSVVPVETPVAKRRKSDVIAPQTLQTPTPSVAPVGNKKRKSDPHVKESAPKKLRRLDSMDKIVSPVVPQPGAWLTKRPSRVQARQTQQQQMPQFKERNKAYQYGNYNRYYGYRNSHHDVDPRLRCFADYPALFLGKDILDVGCNIGHITLSVARDFGAKSIIGLDIDKKLIGIARKNIRHYVNCNESPRQGESQDTDKPKCGKTDKFFPISMPILYGPVDVPGMQKDHVKDKGFPHNVTFVQGNYVLDNDKLLSAEQSQFDVILCLSVTKWLHLNWGDAGLKQAFRRMHAQLRPGGKLILEPQSWVSYKSKKKLTETIYKNYHSIKFFPEKFTQYLLSSSVGFAKSEMIGHPQHPSKGFQRPIQVFTKSDCSQRESVCIAVPSSDTVLNDCVGDSAETNRTDANTVTAQSGDDAVDTT